MSELNLICPLTKQNCIENCAWNMTRIEDFDPICALVAMAIGASKSANYIEEIADDLYESRKRE